MKCYIITARGALPALQLGPNQSQEGVTAMTKIEIAYDGPIVNRTDAVENGDKFFFTNTPCKRGHIDRRRVDNRTCVSCIKFNNAKNVEKKKQWAIENHDKITERRRSYDHLNRVKIKEKSRIRRAMFPEKKAAENKIWWSGNRDKARVYNSRRRALIRNAGGSYTESDVKRMLETQKNKCAEPSCMVDLAEKYHVDHIMPVKLGGCNDPKNLQILCQRCNSKKSAKHPLDWAAENGRLC